MIPEPFAFEDEKPREECAVFGVSLNIGEAVGFTNNGLLSLQHRGQEGAGIAAVDGNRLICRKDVGLVSEVFSREKILELPKSKIAVGHARYSTTGSNKKENVGPFVTEYLTGRIATAHNGNITNALEIRKRLKKFGINFDATSDSEVVSALIAYCIMQERDALSGAVRAAGYLEGAFSLIIATGKNELVVVRDPSGYRPLCIGASEYGTAVSSESCALEACGFKLTRDVEAGEVIVIKDGRVVSEGVKLKKKDNCKGLCIFEYVYFARPDSVIDGLSVYEARHNMGRILAREHPAEADVVCAVLDSGLVAAFGYSAQSGIPYMPGFVKNRYIARSFIYPTQAQRDTAVRLKLNPLRVNVEGKRVVLVDDSIVRGTTCATIVKRLKEAGAAEVHMRVSSPPFKHTCHYGTDIGSVDNLIANKMEVEDIRKIIGADSLGYISIDGLKEACGKCKLPFCTACFTGDCGKVNTDKDVFEN